MSLTIHALPIAIYVKEVTQQLHQAVENILLPKLESIRHADHYAVILKMFYGFYSPLEISIERYITPEHLPDLAMRRKAAAILNDLNQMGQVESGWPVCTLLPGIGSVAEAFGALYVLEGSTLGGRVMAKMLRKNQHLLIPEKALTFFEGYKEETGSHWKTFLMALNQQPYADAIANSANETFLQLKNWMQLSFHENRD